MDELHPAVDLKNQSAAADVLQDVASRTASRSVARCLPVDERLLPSFLIIGPPRTGSSWLYEVLSDHTLLPSPAKETRFFDNHFHRGLKWYIAHYGNSGGDRRVGEVAPTYFASHLARERLAQVVPDAKIICVFRNPVERIVSLYRLKRAYGLIPWNFEQALDRDPEMMDTSRYVGNLKLWRRSFGAENILACIYDDLRDNPQAFVDALVDFIGVPRFTLAASQFASVHNSEKMTLPRSYFRTRSARIAADWFKARRLDRVVSALKGSVLRKLVLGGGRPFSQPPTEVLKQIQERFRPEVEKLEAMLRRDLSSWKLQNHELQAAAELLNPEGKPGE